MSDIDEPQTTLETTPSQLSTPASPPQTKPRLPNLKELLERGRRTGEKLGILNAFITSDKNNPVKARVPSAIGMTGFQMLGAWASTEATVTVEVRGSLRTFPRTVQGFDELTKMYYDENSAALGGEARKELMTAALGYFTGDLDDVDKAKAVRVDEGAKKGQK